MRMNLVWMLDVKSFLCSMLPISCYYRNLSSKHDAVFDDRQRERVACGESERHFLLTFAPNRFCLLITFTSAVANKLQSVMTVLGDWQFSYRPGGAGRMNVPCIVPVAAIRI